MNHTDTSAQTAKIEALLEQMRLSFLSELPEYCDTMEALTLTLEHEFDVSIFNELYRKTHSLKGLGGTQGLSIITAVCHQLENTLNLSENGFVDDNASTVLAYIDMVRSVPGKYHDGGSDFSEIEQELEKLASAQRKENLAILVAESSRMMQGMYQASLEGLPVQLTFVEDGLETLQLLAQQEFDCVFLSKELKQVNGLAVAAALNYSLGKNSKVPIYLVTSNKNEVPEQLKFSDVLYRDPSLGERLVAVINRWRK